VFFVRLQDIRIRNFRSIESQDIEFGDTTILFGKNDSGKSNVVKALEFAFDRSRQVDISNVHVSTSHPEPKESAIAVDVRFVGKMSADLQWLLSFSEDAFNTGEGGEISLSIRTEATYNPETRVFEKSRRIINDWDNGESGGTLPQGLLDSIDFILLDAHRDIAEVVRDRYSRWNQEVRKADISDEEAEGIESKLAELGASIVNASPFLTAAQNDLKGSTDHGASKIEIAPVARNMSELYRSLDVLVTEDAGPSISMSYFGSGTRSRAEFMAFKALVDVAKKDAASQGKPYYCLAVFEEPEAHIHPQSQQQLLMELGKLGNQRVITTHSPYLLAKAPMNFLMHVKRDNHVTTIASLDVDLSEEEKKETERFLLRTHGEMLFADVIVFAEGETEEHALPVFFEHYYGKKPFEVGVTIISVASNKYEPYLRIAHKLGIPWFILSDSEKGVLKSVKNQVARAINEGRPVDLRQIPQVVTCRAGNDFEKDLIDDGYAEVMISAINAREAKGESEDNRQRLPFFDNWMQKNQDNSKGRRKTDRKCETCGQNIYEDEKFDFSGADGRKIALIDFLNQGKNKVRYAAAIAEAIVCIDDEKQTIPSCVKELFKQLDAVMRFSKDKDNV
jgi:putative ATP-dependent endonuclease of OLD family